MGPQYTRCTEAKDFSELNYVYVGLLLAVTVAGIQFALITAGLGGWVAGAAFLEALRYILNWLLNGKLICLHRQSNPDCLCGGPAGVTVCAIGEIVDTENVGQDKNPIEDIDDDYSINLALFPFNIKDFSAKDFVDNKKIWRGTKRTYSDEFRAYLQSLSAIATQPAQVQGDLLTRSQSVHGEVAEFGYLRTMVMLNNGNYLPWTEVVGRDPGKLLSGPDEEDRWTDFMVKNVWLDPKKFSMPVMHCEFEGSRVHDMLKALEGFPFGGSFCKKNWFTKLVCKIVAAVLAPLALLAVLLAWARNTSGSTDPAVVGGGTIGPKDRVIVRGSWVYDAGHQGWNEIHAVRIVQRVDHVPSDPTAFKDFLHRWCDRLAETPTSDGFPQGPLGAYKPQDVPAAELTLVSQRQPENQWEFHPLVDGCQPDDQPPSPPPIH
ncbi:MAG TPA: hypothetical protein VGB76_18110 [Pyrinomonadaceae bacterium]|jgi:hypothetical protein